MATEQNFVFAQTPSPGGAGNNSGIAAPNAADDKTAPHPGEQEPSHAANAHDAEPASTAGSGVEPGNAGAHEQSFNFKDAISHLDASGVELADAGHGPASTNHREHAAGADAHQAIADATPTIGHDHFNAVPDHIANAVFAPVHHDIMV